MTRPRAFARLSSARSYRRARPPPRALASARGSARVLVARRDSDDLVRRDDTQRLDGTAEFDELHALGRYDPLTGSPANRAIVVVAGAGVDQERSLVGVRRGMVVPAMFTVFVVAMHMLAEFAGCTVMRTIAMHMVVCVAVQQVARGAGRQIDDRQQAGCQAISK